MEDQTVINNHVVFSLFRRNLNFNDKIQQVMLTEKFRTNDNLCLLIESQIVKNKSDTQVLPSQSYEERNIPLGTVVPPDLPKLFLDLLVPVAGLKMKKLDYECGICGEELATMNSLMTHNKSHKRPACLRCGLILSSHGRLVAHKAACSVAGCQPVVVTSKYGRSRPVKSYLAPAASFH